MRLAKYCMFFVVPIFVFALLLTALPAVAQTSDTKSFPMEEGLLLKFPVGTTELEARVLVEATGGELIDWIPQIGWAQVRISEVSAASIDEIKFAMGADEVEPIQKISSVLVVSDDAMWRPGDQSWGLWEMKVPRAWNVSTGAITSVIAIVDSGIMVSHVEFIDGRIVGAMNLVDQGTTRTDVVGHGSHVAGIAAAAINNGGMAGVCPECGVLDVKVFSDQEWTTNFIVAKGTTEAADYPGVRVINLSLGSSASSVVMEDATNYAIYQKGVVVVAAAGNWGSDLPFYPADNPGVVKVCALSWDLRGQRASFSNKGTIDLCAPGEAIYSILSWCNNCYIYHDGTSMAAPFVSGALGLIFSISPTLTYSQAVGILTDTAKDLGDPGFDGEFGFGEPDLTSAVEKLIGIPVAADPYLYLPAVANGDVEVGRPVMK